ncbi:uncharacterized protein RCO7_05449 [Rhynchosporium graminicola]|uniref:Zn(2)-C6 fungal-type domain-containing protein n=1 Tax=Rhynchosporium graminicola TaxID=2792576 RepID=A0A1E1KXX9_9HELO|nr:uncharacterized protein RCO7_05449 [Rhynchosporium commune]
MSQKMSPHDPSNPNDPRNWNGRPGPIFMAVNPFDVHKNPVLYSSFTLLPIPAHLQPPAQASFSSPAGTPILNQQQSLVEPSPSEELERRIAELIPGQPIPPSLRSDIEFAGLDQNVRRQNPDQATAPTSVQLLAELRRQKVLTRFYEKHVQLLPELVRHLANNGMAFDAFASHMELDALASEIVNLMARTNENITSEDVQEEIELRIREGSSPAEIDHNIHQLQSLLSQILQQITREEEGDMEIPQVLNDEILYQQVQTYLTGSGIMSTHMDARNDLEKRIKKLRAERARQLGSNPASRALSRVPSLIPDDTPAETPQPENSSGFIREDILKFNMQARSRAGLPAGFAYDPAWRDKGKGTEDTNKIALKFYVNDGPQGPNETGPDYKKRMKRAVKNMGIERRLVPSLSEEEVLSFGNDKAGLAKARQISRLEYTKDSNRHSGMLQDKGKEASEYRARWAAEKRVRQAKNAVRRREAQEELRAEMASRPESWGMRLPTPPPPDDSGDELYDFTVLSGPRNVEGREIKLAKGRQKKARYRQRVDPSKAGAQGTVDSRDSEAISAPPQNTIQCATCHSAGAYCNIANTGRPCTRCLSNGIQCLDRDQEITYTFLNRQTAPRANTGRDDGPANKGRGANPNFKNSYSTSAVYRESRGRTQLVTKKGKMSKRARDVRSRSPTGIFETDSDFGNTDIVPCDNCIVNGRSCDEDGPPCKSCVLNGVEATCDAGALHGQQYQAQPSMMTYDPAQLGTVPDTGAPALDPWGRVNALLEEGIPLTSGAGLNPFQEIPYATQAGMAWNDTDFHLGFTSHTAMANPSAEKMSQSMNWMTNEPAALPGETQYNSFGQELDMHGQIVPGGRMRRDVIVPDPDLPSGNIGNRNFNRILFNINTENGQVEVNNSFDPGADQAMDLFTNIYNMDDTAMGGTLNETLNPQLPNDALSFGQDPARQPEYNIPQDAVLSDIDPLPTLQAIPAQNTHAYPATPLKTRPSLPPKKP